MRFRLSLVAVLTVLPAPAVGGDGPADPQALAAVIDARLKERWHRAGVRPAERSADGEFLRRVTLELIGRIPTGIEARAFLDDTHPDKRRRLVVKLLASSAHVEHSVRAWRALLIPEVAADP